jgi:hypothetical protein
MDLKTGTRDFTSNSGGELFKRRGRRINVDHGINVDQHSKPRNMCRYSILHLHLFGGFEC